MDEIRYESVMFGPPTLRKCSICKALLEAADELEHTKFHNRLSEVAGWARRAAGVLNVRAGWQGGPR